MKSYFVITVLAFFLISCFPVKSVQDINGYHIIDGNKKAGKDFKKQNVFTFQIYKDRSIFERYLRERFKDTPGFSPSNFIATIESVPFTIRVLSKEEVNKYVDFTDFLLKKEDPELVKNGKSKQFVYMIATDENGEDALSTNSFYRYIVANYLDNLRMGFSAY